ncbi:UDP-Glycosyltransferase/glycogen phosphorylase [Aureobasidium subglaciale]|nr:UDP-Glycosyltransferase/glycogen phosphorylase [Aureobasidium subglaciale]KAI5230284.1 UDP-Glycosyltransferase/glycogen phosphorylase [Aureobasidium subglaciale]KAI5233655.1 UDP-Glycosyltransferase/glycogen phosphorylase [Aureobasidium subglaciale]KAI5267005.1 UDP-Glycosyltransferase/glycogen phosphorylase [Aureobasidium subglaciale]
MSPISFSQRKYKIPLDKKAALPADDGRFNVSISTTAVAQLQTLLSQESKDSLGDSQHETAHTRKNFARLNWHQRQDDFKPIIDGFRGSPRMNIAILIVGSRGDVQPFIALGQVLKAAPYNHRVRICTHPVFKTFVESDGLEYYAIGGDPEKLMSYMVRNPGVLPTKASRKAGDVGARRAEIAEMLDGCWRACTEAGNGVDSINLPATKTLSLDSTTSLPDPFIADAIISNPPAYANIHIAERLSVPLHMMFTMPWSPTTAFPHPLTNVKSGASNNKMANYLSYYAMELLTSEGLIDLVNDFRVNTLALDPLHAAWGHQLLPQLKVPFTYCWSPALIPKPQDWGSNIGISGFFFLETAKSSFQPDEALSKFLEAGPSPVYIGFGSIVVDDPDQMTNMILEAVRLSGVRALVSKGWGNLGGKDIPENVFLLGNVPHDWLFPRCSAVVHHGGAGTMAIGIALGKPTVVVPFFGDQPFWGEMVARAGTGPSPIRYKDLTAEKLASQITQALEPQVQDRAKELSDLIRSETGTKTAAGMFHATEQMQILNCFLIPDRVAVWRVRHTNIQLSALGASILIDHNKIDRKSLKPLRKHRWYVEEGAQDPLIGALATLGSTAVGYKTCVSRLNRDIKGPTSKDSVAPKVLFDGQVATDGSGNTLKSIGRFGASIGGKILQFPIDLLYNVTNGFHNAPAHSMGDRTVRMRNEITGIRSGLKAGAEEVCFGLHDAKTGVVTQPIHGFEQDGAVGLVKGVGRVVGGLVCKSVAGTLGLPSHTLKGLARSIRRGWRDSDAAPDEEAIVFLRQLEHLESVSGQKGSADHTQAIALSYVGKASGNGVMRMVRRRRGWQNYIELLQLRQDPQLAAHTEQDVLSRWGSLDAPVKFCSSG